MLDRIRHVTGLTKARNVLSASCVLLLGAVILYTVFFIPNGSKYPLFSVQSNLTTVCAALGLPGGIMTEAFSFTQMTVSDVYCSGLAEGVVKYKDNCPLDTNGDALEVCSKYTAVLTMFCIGDVFLFFLLIASCSVTGRFHRWIGHREGSQKVTPRLASFLILAALVSFALLVAVASIGQRSRSKYEVTSVGVLPQTISYGTPSSQAAFWAAVTMHGVGIGLLAASLHLSGAFGLGSFSVSSVVSRVTDPLKRATSVAASSSTKYKEVQLSVTGITGAHKPTELGPIQLF
jgi:hypothetical protein